MTKNLLAIRIDSELINKLRNIACRTGLSTTGLVRIILIQFLNRPDKQNIILPLETEKEEKPKQKWCPEDGG